MLRKPVGTQKLVRITVPCFVELFLSSLMVIMSSVMVGRLSSEDLTASNMTGTLVNWLQCVYTGLAAGSTIVIGRMWGAGDLKGVKETFVDSMIVITVLSVLIMLLLVIFQRQITDLFFGGADAEVIEKMDIFFKFCMSSMPAIAIGSVVCSCLRGIGDNKTPIYWSFFVNASYLIMAYPMIYGMPMFNIAPRGIFGAGLATILARYLGAIFIIIYIYVRHKPIIPDNISLKINREILKRVIKVGVPSAAEQFIFNGGFVMLQTILIGFGLVLQTGYQIGANLNSIMCVPSQAIGIAITAMTSQALGRKDSSGALENVKAARYLYALVYSTLGILIFIFSESLVRMYTTDSEVMREGIFFIRVFAFESIAIGYFQTMVGVLRGAGDIKYILVSSILALWLCRIGITWFLSKYMDPHIAIAIGLSADFYLRAIMYHLRVQKHGWLSIVV